MPRFVATSVVPAAATRVYAWHARPGAFERLRPPWTSVEVIEREGTIESGRVRLRMKLGPVPCEWVAEHSRGVPGQEFFDRQVRGPFRRWEHLHRFVALDANQCRMEDRVDYDPPLPLSALPKFLGQEPLEASLRRMFAYRHRVVRGDLAVHGRLSAKPLRFLVSGASGLIGSALCAFLTTGGHSVTRLVRRPPRGADEAFWDPQRPELALGAEQRFDVVVHLAGANIANGRWTTERKAAITASRVEGTRHIAEALARLQHKPRVLVCASAIGFYGDRGSEAVDEEAARGQGFLAEVCDAWERASKAAEAAGIRVVKLRIGVVLTAAGGALAQMLPLFRAGLGGRVGNGRQYMSWIAIDDVLSAILHCAVTENLHGPVNAVAPAAVTNAELTRTLARVLHRPALLPVPAPALRLVLGEMAQELLLSSTRVWPRRLIESGFSFQYAELESCLRHQLGATFFPLEDPPQA
jgi:uncharacterized protein (TIGR01777 family)